MFGCGMLFVFNWDLFKRQLIGLSCESGFFENREAGRPGCGAQVDLTDGRQGCGAQVNYSVVRVGSIFFRLICG